MMSTELALAICERRGRLVKRFFEVAHLAAKYPSRMNRGVQPQHVPGFVVKRVATAYGTLLDRGVPTWLEFLLMMHVMHDGMLELDAFVTWAEDMGRWARGHPTLVRRHCRGAIFSLSDQSALEAYVSRNIPVYFRNDARIPLGHCGASRPAPTPSSFSQFGKPLFSPGNDFSCRSCSYNPGLNIHPRSKTCLGTALLPSGWCTGGGVRASSSGCHSAHRRTSSHSTSGGTASVPD